MDEGIYLHYPDTCNVHDARIVSSAQSPWAPRKTKMGEPRPVPSSRGWVEVCYETKGLITFFVQLEPDRAAWQRIEWPTGFDTHWDEDKVKKAIDNFIWVADCENAKQILPK
jgi:hypothetical protein